jgi:hypothetical protein
MQCGVRFGWNAAQIQFRADDPPRRERLFIELDPIQYSFLHGMEFNPNTRWGGVAFHCVKLPKPVVSTSFPDVLCLPFRLIDPKPKLKAIQSPLSSSRI